MKPLASLAESILSKQRIRRKRLFCLKQRPAEILARRSDPGSTSHVYAHLFKGHLI
jgi:hypothetical protein